jgi:hypothetical protein
LWRRSAQDDTFVFLIGLFGTTEQLAEKVGMESKRAKFGGCKTISQSSRIVPGASWRVPFFVRFEKSTFPASCEVVP